MEKNIDYKKAYQDVREVLDDVRVEKAIEFARRNPELVYGKGTEECQSVLYGFFSLYFADRRSNS